MLSNGQKQTEQLERTTRITFTKHNNLRSETAIERLAIKRQVSGKGLIDIQHFWEKQIHNFKIFFHTKSISSDGQKPISENDHNYTPLHLIEHTHKTLTLMIHKHKI